MPIVYDLNNPINWKAINKNIFVDTNVVCPIYYDKSALVQNSASHSSAIYQQAISNIFSTGMHIHISSLVMMEMSRVFTRWDMKIYKTMNPGSIVSSNIKQYRKINSEMQLRKQRYSIIFSQLENAPEIEIHDTTISSDNSFEYFRTMDSHSMDTNDFVIGRLAQKNNGILMTDDVDFGNSVIGIDLITENSNLISEVITLGYNLANPLSV